MLPALKPMARAIYAAAALLGERDGAVAVAPPNDVHLAKCEQHRAAVEAAIASVAGGPVPLLLVVEPAGVPGAASSATTTPTASGGRRALAGDDDPFADAVDPDELTDGPPVAMQSPVERLTEAFPGSELIEGGG